MVGSTIDWTDATEWTREVREKLWSRSRTLGRVPIAGRFYYPPPPVWAYFIHTTFRIKFSDSTAIRLEQATKKAFSRLARETGTHIAGQYAVAATQAGNLHIHALLGIDPVAQARRGLLEALRPRRSFGPAPVSLPIMELEETPIEEHATIRYLSSVVLAQAAAAGLSPMESGHRITRYNEWGAQSGGFMIKHDKERDCDTVVRANDLDGSAYLLTQKAHGGHKPRIDFIEQCPGADARVRACRRGACHLGLKSALLPSELG